MSLLDDVFKTLDRIPIWKRLQTVPDEVDTLNARVGALEEKLSGKWPGDVCRYCGARAARLNSTLGPNQKGLILENWFCAECEKSDDRWVKPR